jgi:hypothetical protein
MLIINKKKTMLIHYEKIAIDGIYGRKDDI